MTKPHRPAAGGSAQPIVHLPNGEPVPPFTIEAGDRGARCLFACGCIVERSTVKPGCTKCPAAIAPCELHAHGSETATPRDRKTLRHIGAAAAGLPVRDPDSPGNTTAPKGSACQGCGGNGGSFAADGMGWQYGNPDPPASGPNIGQPDGET